MKKTIVLAAAMGLLLATALPAVAQSTRKPLRLVRMTGWVVDEESGAEHANADSKEAVLAKQKAGVPLVFVEADGTMHALANQELALDKVGQEWVILGTVDEDGNLKVGSYIPPKKPPAKTGEAEDPAKADAAAEAAESDKTEEPERP